MTAQVQKHVSSSVATTPATIVALVKLSPSGVCVMLQVSEVHTNRQKVPFFTCFFQNNLMPMKKPGGYRRLDFWLISYRFSGSIFSETKSVPTSKCRQPSFSGLLILGSSSTAPRCPETGNYFIVFLLASKSVTMGLKCKYYVKLLS